MERYLPSSKSQVGEKAAKRVLIQNERVERTTGKGRLRRRLNYLSQKKGKESSGRPFEPFLSKGPAGREK